MVAAGGAQQACRRRRDAGPVVVPLIGRRVPEIHRARQQIDRGDAVGQRVVDLADQREASAGQPFGEVELPQWSAAVQGRGGDLADDGVELSTAAGRRHLHPPQVVIQVDLAVLQPHRMVQPPGDVDELVAQRFQQMQPTEQMTPEGIEVELGFAAGRGR